MIDIVQSNLSSLRDLCKRCSVLRLELFGSAATGEFDASRSDLDFLVEFLPVPRHGLNDVYFELLAGLESILDRKIDLVEVGAIRNEYFRASAEATRVPVYAAA